MSDERFLQDGFDKRLSHAIEECGEFLAAAGKTQRWGVWSTNPLLPPAERESNLTWLIREMTDVRQALNRLSEAIGLEFTVGHQWQSTDPLKDPKYLADIQALQDFVDCGHGQVVQNGCRCCEEKIGHPLEDDSTFTSTTEQG